MTEPLGQSIAVIFRQAGGIVTDFSGGSNYLITGNIVAGPSAIHKELLKDVKSVFKGVIDK